MTKPHPVVGIVMGSDSDLPVMHSACKILEKFGFTRFSENEKKMGLYYEVDIVSAHRTPKKLTSYGSEAESRGLEVIIAGAGGSAHLPGMLASFSSLPVIGVPIQTKDLGGHDSLLSIVQMPNGIPVATVGINRAENAGILAAEILGSKYPEVREAVRKHKKELEDMVHNKSKNLMDLGPSVYVEKMEKK